MDASSKNGAERRRIGASLLVPTAPERVYAAVLDAQRFPEWAAGVRGVEILRQSEPPNSPGMVSEWEVSVLGVRRRVVSVLEETEAPRHLRWSYVSVLDGWGECRIRPNGSGTLVEFATEFRVCEPHVERLLRSPISENVMRHYLQRSLLRLGEISLPDGQGRDGVRVGPLGGLRG
ncbi:SRPBCC family protein [Rubrobacter taiwanensis]|jgi:ribosome-associated toxin RatA of RatAB toxin-antitoxin module|uniref:SRPBCC family protein n=1 Tax=Rubrobacter taiwanensis TaxID=185139 RepID=A0A4R1BL26_9ACTN|nr:SRPBCC family protein [Rubrobacter taiwanensis]TCJ18083.1 SRPBCC family protein [Rubrobacter taiwanensis]